MCVKKYLSILVIGVVLLLPISAKAITFVPSCEKSCPTENGKCEQTCKIDVTGNTSSLAEVSPVLTIRGDADKVSVKSVTPGTGWEVSHSRTGNVINMAFLATTPITSESFTLATFVLELEDKAVDCSLSLKVDDVTVEVEVETTTEVETGVTLPLAIIACAGVAAGVVYYASKKNTKMYKI